MVCALSLSRTTLVNRAFGSNLVGFFYLIGAFFLFRAVSCEDAKCYSPNGDLQIHHVPCNPAASASGGASFCCGRGFNCLSNKVCMLSQDTETGEFTRIGSTYRASCTDKSWDSPECPPFCKSKPWLSINNQAVSSCGRHSWCCQNETADAPYCCVGKEIFTLDSVREDVVIIPAFANSQNSSSTSIGSSRSPSSTATKKSVSSGGSTTLPTSTTSLTTDSAKSSTSAQSASSNEETRLQTIALGVGHGIPLTLALITCLFFVVRNRLRPATPLGELEEVLPPTEGPSWVMELSGHKEFELPVERDMPAEVSGRPFSGKPI